MKKTEDLTFADLFAFLQAVKENNNREWFAEHKAEYEALRAWWLVQLQRLIDAMARLDPRLKFVEARDCTYRFYRDTRFSPDKTPYKTYFSALISPRGRHTDYACSYFHVGVDEVALYSGLWAPESKVLKKVRKAIIDNVDEFRSLVETPEILREFPDWWGPKLKTAPQGYSRDHPDIDLLRLTEYGRCHELKRSFFDRADWPEEAARILDLLRPMNDFLNYSIDE